MGNVTDHKHIFFQNSHYLLYSTTGDDDLYLIKLDTNFAQVGTTVTVASNSANTKTNDMLLATDGTYIVTGQFRPSDLNNNENSGHLIKKYETNLAYVSPDFTANAYAHTNTASMMSMGSQMYIVAPSLPVFGGQVQTQLDLLLLRFDSSFNPVDTSAKKLVDSTTLTHGSNGDGIWMSTGLAYDSQSDKLIVGHTFRDAASGSDTGKIHLRVFDGTTFSQTYTETMVDSTMANRAHFLLLNDTLYVVYDDSTSGSPTIYGLKYALTRGADTSTSDPAPDIKANGSDGPLTLGTTGTLSVSLSLTAGSGAGTSADWWVLAQYSENWYDYNLCTNSWQSGTTVTYQGALEDLSTYTLPNVSGLSPGSYILYFGVDTLMNGLVSTDMIYYDKVDLTVQ